MKKILFINGHLNAGGVERSLTDVLRHIDFSEYEVDLLLLEGMGDYAAELPPSVNLIFKDIHNTYGSVFSSLRRCVSARDGLCLKLKMMFTMRRFFGASALKTAAKPLLGQHHYDCVIGFRPGICSDLAAYSVNADRKITWWHHGEINVDPAAYADMCAHMDAVAVVSTACVNLLKADIPEIGSKLVCVPNMVDTEALEQKCGASPYSGGLLHIVSVGRLAPEKHFENIIPTARVLRDNGVEFKWHIVGDGSERERLETLIAENNLADCLVLEGSKSNPYPYMKYADLFVHPSYIESQGLTVLEAMALGVPCVVTKSKGPCEFIEDGVNALLTEQNSESLTEKVLEILSNTNLYQRIKNNTKCPEEFAPERVMKQIEALIDGGE